MAAQGLKWGGQAIVFHFIVPAENPDFPFVLYSDLGRAHDMAGWMQAEFHAVYREDFPPGPASNIDIAQAVPYDGYIEFMGDIFPVPRATVICMPMGNYGFVYRTPGVEVDRRRRAVNTFVCKFQQGFGHSALKLKN